MQLLRRNSSCCAWRCSRNTLRLFIRAVVLIVSIIASGVHHRPAFGLTSEERSELARKFKYYHRTVRPALELNMLDTLNGTFFRLVTELELQDTFQAPESEAHRLSVDFALFVHYRDDRLLLRDLPGSMAIPDEFQPWTPRIQPMPMELAHGLLVQKSSTFEPKTGHLTAIFRFYGTIRCEFDAWKVPFERYKCLFWLETDPEERLALRTLRDLRPNWQMRRVKITIDHWPFLTLSLTFQSHRWHHTLVSAYVPSFLLFSCALVAQWRRRKIQVIVTMGALLAILILFHQHSQIVLPLKSSTTLLDLWLGVVFVHLVCLLSADLLLPARQTVVFKKASRRGLYSSSYSSPPIQNGRTLTSSQPLYSTPHYVSSTHLQPLSHGTAHPTSRLSRHITPSPGQLIRTLSVPPPLRRLAAQVTRRAELPPPAHSEPLQRRQTTTALSRAADSGEQRAQRIATLLAEMESIRREAEDIGPPLRHADSVVAVDELIAAAAASSEAVLFKTFARPPPAEPPKTTTTTTPTTALNTWAMKRFPSAITSLRFLATKSMSAAPLMRQLAEIEANPPHGFSLQGIVDGNILKWRVVIFGPPNTLYEGGTFVAQLDFPRSYPQRPPKMRFLSHIFHPNIYADGGEVCVSILDDAEDGRPSEAFLRWQPVHTVESIVISVQSLLAEPNFRSPANYRASAMFHTNPEAYSDMVRRCVKESNRFFEQE